MHARLYPRRLGVDDVLELVGLEDKRNARVRTLSGGQRRRLDLALGLVGDPDLLFLDEPTTGFDPTARRKAWELVESLRTLGKTVLLTTHYMDEAEHLADRVAVIVRGRLVALGTPGELGAGERSTSVVSFRLPAGIDPADLPKLDGGVTQNGTDFELETTEPTRSLHELTTWAIEHAVEVPVPVGRAPVPRGRLPGARGGSRSGRGCAGGRVVTALAHLTPRGVVTRRPAAIALVLDQTGYAARELWRSRLVLVFTFVLPLVWLVLIGFMAGNEAVDESTGVRVMQFATPAAAVMGLLFSAYPPVANSLALAREQKITKRLAGTPLPMWAYLLGRVGAAIVLSAAAVVVMLAVGAIAYGVQIQWRSALATVVTLGTGIGCLAAIGLAVGSLARSASTAQTFSFASAVVLAFLSGVMTMGLTPPAWMGTFASFFPVRPLLTSIQDQFNPFMGGSGWDLGAIAVLAAWGVAAVLVASWALRREPRASTAAAAVPGRAGTREGLRASEPGRPSALALIVDQTRWATTVARRDAGWVFFAVAMPVGLYALLTMQLRDTGFRPGGMAFALYFAVGMAAYGASVTAFLNMPEAVATARDRGLLKRLRGTPLTPWQYLAGRTTSVLAIAFLTAVLVFASGVLFFDLEIPLAGLPIALAVLLLGTLTVAACGYALAAVAPSGRAMAVIGLAILLPLSFVSDVFAIGGTMPELLTTIGSLFPLRHFVHALTAAFDPDGVSVAWTNLAVMGAWLVGASVVAVRRFRWEPKR